MQERKRCQEKRFMEELDWYKSSMATFYGDYMLRTKDPVLVHHLELKRLKRLF